MSRGACPPVPALVAAAVLAFAGCGDDAPGGDPSAFATRTDGACARLADAVGTLREDLVRGPAHSEAEGLSRALRRYATAVRRTADDLVAGRPPRDERAFRDAAVRGLRRHAHAMTRAAAEAGQGRVARELEDELRGGALPAVPAQLLEQAPRCRHDTGR